MAASSKTAVVTLELFPIPNITDFLIHYDRLRSALPEKDAESVIYRIVNDGFFKQVSSNKPVSLVRVVNTCRDDNNHGNKLAATIGTFWLPFANVQVIFDNGSSQFLTLGSGEEFVGAD